MRLRNISFSIFLPVLSLLFQVDQLHSQRVVFVDEEVETRLKTSETVRINVYFGQTDLSGIDSRLSKASKGRKAYSMLKTHADRTQRDVRGFLEEKAVDYRSFFSTNIISLTADEQLIRELKKKEDIIAILFDAPTMAAKPEEVAITSNSTREDTLTWGLEMVLADSVWAMGHKGRGVVIAGEDTGVKWDIPSIENTYRGRSGSHDYHWHDAIHEINPMHGDSVILPENNPCGLDVREPCDDHGHGTHTVGTMVGEVGEIKIGMAPEAEWIACRCMERGYGTLATYVECFDFFLAPTDLDGENPDPTLAPHVINNSWGCPPNEGCNISNWSIMEDAVEALRAAGIVVVVSAGNDGGRGCSSISNPASIFKGSFTVGATNRRDSITGFSSRGPVMVDSSGRMKPDVSAPGARVLSQLPDSSFAAWNGTSMAGPHVAGLVALMISANPRLAGRVDIIEDIIRRNAVPKTQPSDSCDVDGNAVPNNIYGYGRINAFAAVKEALTWISTTTVNDEFPDIKYANPVADVIELKFDDGVQIRRLNIVDAAGRRVMRFSQNEKSYDVSGLKTGIYILEIELENRMKRSFKFVKI